MRPITGWKFRGIAIAAAGALAVGLAGYPAPAGASLVARSARRAAKGRPAGVLPMAAKGTPALPQTDSQPESYVRQLVQCGGTMYAVGSFDSIIWEGTAYPRDNAFSFSATAPYTVTSWAPDVNGRVNTIAFSGSNCADAYIGGRFTSINGTSVSDIAEIKTTSGDVVPRFGTRAHGEVETMVSAGGHLLVGGYFDYINGSHDPYLASVSPVTGQDDGFVDLNLSGTYDYCDSGGKPCTRAGNRTMVYNQQLSHSGTLDLVEGRFTSVGGLPRRQIFMLNLATDPATVTGWTSPQWDGTSSSYPYNCDAVEAFYIRSAAWSPDDSTVYIATTGLHPATTRGHAGGLCDAAASFPATQEPVTDNWVEYTGCDSYYSVAADDAAVYVAGHPRWAENPHGCNHPGAGAVPDHGLQGLNPATGTVELNSGGTALYAMGRANADDMLITSAGLWIASSSRYEADRCGDATATGVSGPAGKGHTGICFLPYRS